MYVKTGFNKLDALSLINFVANEYSNTQNNIAKIFRSSVSMRNCNKGGLIFSKPAILSSIDLIMEESIMALPVSTVTETLGSRNRDSLNPVTIVSTKITGRTASRTRARGVFKGVFTAFPNWLSLQVRIPKTNMRKNMKKR